MKGDMIVVMILIKLLEFGRVEGQDASPYVCSRSNGNYTVGNSTYGSNLKSLLDSMAFNMSDYGFYRSSLGQVYAFALCQDECRSCVEAASHEILQRCPNQRQAELWEEFCTLRYSNTPTLNQLTEHRKVIFYNSVDESTAAYFREDVSILLQSLRIQASGGNSHLKVGVGFRNISGSQTLLYGLVQCTPDLSSEECRGCLAELSDASSTLLDRFTRGIRVLSPNCNLRYDLYNFYNQTRLRELRILPSLPPSPPGRSDDHDSTKPVISIAVPIGVCLIIVVCAATVLTKRIKRRKQESIRRAAEEISSVESLHYDYGKIRAATSDFGDDNKLGQGGFGAVYWGKLEDGQEIAAKRLSKNSGQGDIEFKNEVLLVAKLQHRNLVRLLGFSLEGIERILVYEFVHNASLDKFIFDPVRRSELDWDARYKIIEGVARGLLYLHQDSRLRIIHRDLKASNVLLDADMNPKIADFGMARLFTQDETQGNTERIVGTYGYMAPEYAMHGQFSIKSDVFSFGVLILEIISGRRNNIIRRGDNLEDLLTLTWENWEQGGIGNMIDPVLRNNGESDSEMLRCMHMGLLCVQENSGNRPTMSWVVSMLNSSNATLPEPLKPAFYMGSRYDHKVAFSEDDSNMRLLEEVEGGVSLNDMSVTELNPR